MKWMNGMNGINKWRNEWVNEWMNDWMTGFDYFPYQKGEKMPKRASLPVNDTDTKHSRIRLQYCPADDRLGWHCKHNFFIPILDDHEHLRGDRQETVEPDVEAEVFHRDWPHHRRDASDFRDAAEPRAVLLPSTAEGELTCTIHKTSPPTPLSQGQYWDVFRTIVSTRIS